MFKRRKGESALSLIFMIFISCAAQIVSVMKSSVVAGTFGASEAMDAYHFANSIISLLFGIVASGIPTIILPSYVKKQDRKGIDAFITLIYGSLFIFIALLIAFRYQIVYVFTDRSEMFANIACNALLVLAFCQYLNSVLGITSAYFQSKGHLNIPKIINLLSQMVVLLLLMIRNTDDIYEYIWIIGSGLVINFILDVVIAICVGWRFKPCFQWKNSVTKDLLKVFAPIMFSSGVYQLTLFIDSMVASNLDEGKLTILNYSNMIVNMISSLIIGNMLIYIYPKLIRRLSDGENQPYFWNQTTFFHFVVCMLFVGFVTVGKEGIALLFQRGLFDENTTLYVYAGAVLYIFGLQFNIIRDMLYRYFYCLGNTRIPAKNSLIASIANVALSIFLAQFMGLFGIILGTVLSTVLSLVMILARFHKKEKIDHSFLSALARYLKNILAGAVTIGIVLLAKQLFTIDNYFVAIAVYGVETVAIYLGITLLINKRTIKAIKE